MGRAEFADRVDRLLDDKDLDQLARTVNIKDKSAFSHYRVGKRAPNLDRFAALCRALDVSADYLLGLVDEIRPVSAAPEVGAAYHADLGQYFKIRFCCPYCNELVEAESALQPASEVSMQQGRKGKGRR